MLIGKSPMAVEESKNREEYSIGQTGTPVHQPTVDIVEETDAAAATKPATSDSSSMVIGQVAANTSDSDGEDASATGADTTLIIDPTYAEAGTAMLSAAPANTVATGDRDVIYNTMSTERHNAHNSAVAVVVGNESHAVSMSKSTASSRHSESSEGGLIHHSRLSLILTSTDAQPTTKTTTRHITWEPRSQASYIRTRVSLDTQPSSQNQDGLRYTRERL